MRLHILGISGTFMSGIAVLAKQAGHVVVGSDANIYPPMSTQLMEQGIEVKEGYDAAHLSSDTDCVIVGNVIRRGNPVIEHVLAQKIPYVSGPQWLAQHVLAQRWVLGVAGTHGKTTTASLLTWILETAGLRPGFLIGGVPENFGVSARLGESPYFVVEADEYDSAFFDKRAKFLHYQPKTLILNNLEYDHADIYPDLAAIQQQFHYLIRTVPSNGLLVCHANDVHLTQVLNMGVWTPVTLFGGEGGHDTVSGPPRSSAPHVPSTAGMQSAWKAELIKEDGSAFSVLHWGRRLGEVHWDLVGAHNVENALAAIAAAYHANVWPAVAIQALATFKNVKRRLEVKGKAKEIVIYDDFAHHPTAIASTLAGLRAKIGKEARMIAVLEFGSYTMRSGVHKDHIQGALLNADMVICKSPAQDWGLKKILDQFTQPAALYDDVDVLVAQLAPELRAGDHVIIMSNSGFGGIHHKLLAAIERGGA